MDNAETHQEPQKQPPPSFTSVLRRFVITMAVLAVVWVVFAQALPLMFLPVSQRISPETTIAAPDPVAEEAPVTQISFESHTADKTLLIEEKLQALQQRVETLEKELAEAKKLSSQPQENALASETVRMLNDRLQEQEKTVATLKSELGSDKQEAWNTVTLWQAYDALKVSLNNSEPFTDSLEHFSSLTADKNEVQRALESLRPYADDGIPSLAFLQENFADIIPEALHIPPSPDTGVWNKLKHNIKGLVSIRKVGNQTGTSSEAIIARAEQALQQQDVRTSLKEISTLPEAPREAFSAWENHAQAFLTRSSALTTLQRALNRQPEASAPAS